MSVIEHFQSTWESAEDAILRWSAPPHSDALGHLGKQYIDGRLPGVDEPATKAFKFYTAPPFCAIHLMLDDVRHPEFEPATSADKKKFITASRVMAPENLDRDAPFKFCDCGDALACVQEEKNGGDGILVHGFCLAETGEQLCARDMAVYVLISLMHYRGVFVNDAFSPTLFLEEANRLFEPVYAWDIRLIELLKNYSKLSDKWAHSNGMSRFVKKPMWEFVDGLMIIRPELQFFLCFGDDDCMVPPNSPLPLNKKFYHCPLPHVPAGAARGVFRQKVEFLSALGTPGFYQELFITRELASQMRGGRTEDLLRRVWPKGTRTSLGYFLDVFEHNPEVPLLLHEDAASLADRSLAMYAIEVINSVRVTVENNKKRRMGSGLTGKGLFQVSANVRLVEARDNVLHVRVEPGRLRMNEKGKWIGFYPFANRDPLSSREAKTVEDVVYMDNVLWGIISEIGADGKNVTVTLLSGTDVRITARRLTCLLIEPLPHSMMTFDLHRLER